MNTDVKEEAAGDDAQPQKSAWNDGDVTSDAPVGQGQRPKPAVDPLLPLAAAELNRYCKFLVVQDVTDAHGLATVLPEPLSCIFASSLIGVSKVCTYSRQL